MPPLSTDPSPGQRRSSARVHRPLRRGFTLVELLVVIGLIVVLAGLVVVGITSFLGKGRDDSTRSRMEILNNFMAAYATSEATRSGGQGNVDAAKLPSLLRVNENADGRYSTVDSGADDGAPGAPPPPATFFTRKPLRAPNPSASAPYTASDPERYPPQFVEDNWIIEPAVARTQAVLRRLLSVPANQSAFASLSEDAKTRVTADAFGGTPSLLWQASPGGALEPTLIVDGHGNPIIFVPASGLSDLRFSDGTWLNPDTTTSGEPFRLVASKGGPFWVSAGPDGLIGGHPGDDGTWGTADDVAGADDNVYSTTTMIERVP